jgi:hypothetical protein
MGCGEFGLARDGLSWTRTGLNMGWAGGGSAGRPGLDMGCTLHRFGWPWAVLELDRIGSFLEWKKFQHLTKFKKFQGSEIYKISNFQNVIIIEITKFSRFKNFQHSIVTKI